MRTLRLLLLAAFISFGLGSACLLYAGYSLCKPNNHLLAEIPDPGIRRVEIKGGDEIRGEDNRITVAWVAAGSNGKGIILAHGNSSDRSSMLPRMRYFQSLGYSVIAPDLNAHGETQGKWKTFGFRESKDIAKSDAYLRNELGAEWVAALGSSLGGASILKAEADGVGVDAIIIESVFSDIRTAARNRLEMRMGRIGDFVEPLLTAQIPLWLGLPRRAICPVEWAKKCRVPILVLSGASDLRAKPWESQAIFSQVPTPRKRLRFFQGAGHVDLFAFKETEYEQEINRFLNEIRADSAFHG